MGKLGDSRRSMTPPRFGALTSVALIATACAAPAPPPTTTAPPTQTPAMRELAPLPAETHFAKLRQLTFGGENAEAYWSWAGDQLILQARPPEASCDRIFRLPFAADGRPASALLPVSSGRGATTCSFFLPGDREVIFASTEAGGAVCPPRPDHSQGYVWALYPDYDIYRANADGSGARRLTTTPGYDAEGTVCGKDGSIVFTSVRDGDIDVYRMDADGNNVKRLTHDVGYDGGAVFDADCTHIVWRASRPKPGQELDDYKRLLAHNLVRPTKLELYVADADGSNAHQVTYLDAASFGPAFMPGGQRLIFASNYGDPQGREFDLWAIDVAGTHLERITHAPGFDGFPLFSPDGKQLAFASNRATAPGKHDTNVFVADWRTEEPDLSDRHGHLPNASADRILSDIRWLADPAREGRGVGTAGLDAAGAYIEERFRLLNLEPAGDGGGYRQAFPVRTGLKVEAATALAMAGTAVPRDAFEPLGFSAAGKAAGPLVLAGHGLVDKELGIDDYAGIDARGKIVVVRRFVPEHPALATPERQRRAGDLRQKAWVAREHGARALLVVDLPTRPKDAPADWKPPAEPPLSPPRPSGYGDAGIPVMVVKRSVLEPIIAKLERKQRVEAKLEVALSYTTKQAFNVVGRLSGVTAGAGPAGPKDVIVIGAHYDHLGLGEHHSLAPDSHLPHVGADDNASGTATVLEIARQLTTGERGLTRDVVFVAFSGEEEGTLGSTHFTRTPPGGLKMSDVRAMINLDMVGRLRDNRATILGSGSAAEWPGLLAEACATARIDCAPASDGGFGPSDQTPFYAAGVPVVHFFTGSHSDYHKPSDVADRINAAGAAQISVAVIALATAVASRKDAFTFQRMTGPPAEGDARSFNASLGTIPDYAGPPGGAPGVLLAGVRGGAPADKGGLRRGDILVKLGAHTIGGVEDLMYALNASKPGETVTAVVRRDGQELKLTVTFEEGRRGK
jgi:Tol biopolymer transport system component